MVSCQATGFGEPTVVVEKVQARCQYAEAELPSDRLLKGELVEGIKPAELASCQKLRMPTARRSFRQKVQRATDEAAEPRLLIQTEGKGEICAGAMTQKGEIRPRYDEIRRENVLKRCTDVCQK